MTDEDGKFPNSLDLGAYVQPSTLVSEHGLEQLCATAEDYFARVFDHSPWLAKPFASLLEAPELLQNVGALLSGLRLGQTMTVLDFGAGSCWVSRILTQLHCRAIACDVSPTALEIGRQLFARTPPIGADLLPPTFLLFDGRHIDLPDNSVDRIICNDAFHHVPNETVVLHEFSRLLKPGGIAGFSEPGTQHSRNPQSQFEMKNFGVLERDIDLPEILAIANRAGFTDMTCTLLGDMEVGIADYFSILNHDAASKRGLNHKPAGAVVETAIVDHVRSNANRRSIFFLHKGSWVPDSRQHVGLRHRISVTPSRFQIRSGERQHFTASVENVGTAQWLTNNFGSLGVVRLGTHLYNRDGKLVSFDFSRHTLGNDVPPQHTTTASDSILFTDRGSFMLAFDLVAEGVCWFEVLGSEPVYVAVTVE